MRGWDSPDNEIVSEQTLTVSTLIQAGADHGASSFVHRTHRAPHALPDVAVAQVSHATI